MLGFEADLEVFELIRVANRLLHWEGTLLLLLYYCGGRWQLLLVNLLGRVIMHFILIVFLSILSGFFDNFSWCWILNGFSWNSRLGHNFLNLRLVNIRWTHLQNVLLRHYLVKSFTINRILNHCSVHLLRNLMFHRLFFLFLGNQTTLEELRYEILGLSCLLIYWDCLVALECSNSLLMDDWLSIQYYTVMISLLKGLLLHSFRII